MKKRIIFLMIVICMCLTGCTRDEKVSSLSKYEMVSIDKINCQDFI